MRQDFAASPGVVCKRAERVGSHDAVVMGRVSEDIRDRVHELRRRREDARVVVIGEDAAVPAHDAIEPLGDAHAQSLHAARLGFIRIGLHDEVEVIRENRELDDSQAKATGGRSKAALEDAEAPLRPEVPDVGGNAQGDVKSADFVEPRAQVVRDEGAWSVWFAPGAVSPSTPRGQPEFELAPAHLILRFDTGEIARGV